MLSLTLCFYLCSLILPQYWRFCHNDIGHSRRHAPNPYRSNALSIFCFCPFKSFCFSYKLSRSLQSDFMCSNCVRTPSRQSGSIRLYSPVILRISLLFDFICSDTHIQSIRLRTSISVSYKSVSERIFAHSRTITFFSISVKKISGKITIFSRFGDIPSTKSVTDTAEINPR